MDDDRFLTPEMRASLRAQRPPSRFAERVMGEVARVRGGRRRRVVVATAAGILVAAAASAGLVARRAPSGGDVRATDRRDVHLGPRIVAVLAPGAHVAWRGDDVTQLSGDVFYRVEPGGAARVRTGAGDVTVHGTCFDVKVLGGEEARTMTGRDKRSAALGALATASVLVGVYEGSVTLSHAETSIELRSGQAARADARGVHGPDDLASAERAFASSANDESWRVANAGLTDQLALYQRKLDENEADKKRIERELRQLKEKVAAGEPDGGRPRDVMKVDPRDLTSDDLKELAKRGVVRTRFFCPPPGEWRATPEQLATLGLSPSDGPALEHAVAATQAQMWQVVGPECTKLVGSVALATRLGAEMCGLIIQSAPSKEASDQSIQLVADILAGNKAMPSSPPDPLTARILAEAQQSAVFEKDLAEAVGPDAARSVARNDDFELSCAMNFAP